MNKWVSEAPIDFGTFSYFFGEIQKLMSSSLERRKGCNHIFTPGLLKLQQMAD